MAMTMNNDQRFSILNLPYGIISTHNNPNLRCSTAFKDYAIELGVLHGLGVFGSIPELKENVFSHTAWNAFAVLPTSVRRQYRSVLTKYISTHDPTESSLSSIFIPLSEITLHFPMDTRNYSDFYCSLEHTKNCSEIFSLNINPNWFVQPAVYNGRTSSLCVTGSPVTRPCGIFPTESSLPNQSQPQFQPETHFDFELEMGVFLGKPLPRGQRLKIEHAKDHIFGMVMLNDWSARKIQFFEMAPLGPFHGKGAATSISGWIVPIEALEDKASCRRHVESVQVLEPPNMLKWSRDADSETWDVDVRVSIARDGKTYLVGESNLNELYWSPLQQITHLGMAGEGLSTGDIFGTGTLSSSRTDANGEKTGLGCLWERKLPRAKLSTLPEDLTETMLKDGDEVIIEGWCKNKSSGEMLLGFGECRSKVLPAIPT